MNEHSTRFPKERPTAMGTRIEGDAASRPTARSARAKRRRSALASATAAAILSLAVLTGCNAFPYADQTVTARVTSVEGTQVTAEVLDDASSGAPDAGGAAAGNADYEPQPDEAFAVGDETVYTTAPTDLHPTTITGAEGVPLRLEDSSLAMDVEGVSLENGTLTIAKSGTYRLSGDFHGSINITASDEVRLQLAGFTLTSDATPCIRSAVTLVLEPASGTNLIASDGTYEGEDEVPAAIEGAGAVFVEGEGSLEVHGGGHAISAQTILGVDGASLTLKAGEDALYSAADLRISDGTIAAEAGDDVAHGDLVLVVEGGSLSGEGTEGLESEKIYIRDGSATLATSDDGVNAAEPEAYDDGAAAPEGYSERESCLIAIGGGTLAVDAKGDGLDSNGSVEVRGGTTTVSSLAPNSGEANAPLDYEAAAVLSGGTMLMTGDGSMAQGFTAASQPYVLCRASGDAGQEVALEAGGQTLASMTAAQAFDVVVATAPGLTDGESAQVSVAGQATDATATTEAQSMGAMGAMGAGGEPPATPEGGEAPQGTSPEQQGGQSQQGTPPEQQGDQSQQGTPPEPPTDGSGQPAAPPDGQGANGEDRPTPPERPDNGAEPQGAGTAPSGQGTAPDAGAAPAGEGQGQGEPQGTGETITFTVDEATAQTLKAGDVIRVTFGSDAVAQKVETVGGTGPGAAMGGPSRADEEASAA